MSAMMPTCATEQTADGHRSPGCVIEMYGDSHQEPPTSKANASLAIDGYTLYDDEATTATAKSGRFLQLLNRFGTIYSNQLESNPIRTKSLTAGTLSVLGDLIAQGIEAPFENTGEESSGLDGRRVLAMFIEGLCFSGPSMHYAYEYFEYLFPIFTCCHCMEPVLHEEDVQVVQANGDVIPVVREDVVDDAAHVADKETDWKNVLIHVAFDEIFMGMWYVAGLMFITCVIEGHYDDLASEFKNDYFRNLGASWAVDGLFFTPMQIFAFGKLDVTYRVLAVNLLDILWIAVMSIVTHLNRDVSERKSMTAFLIPMMSMIGDNIVDST